ncbi:DNA polymerase III PolC-type domain protein [Corynebacterium simulans]|uniref:DNA polymerase III PolC-type domain protein n=1 Tax=Corynebacterium simulans TaxID=146827 RepID=A0ABR5V6H7_9CORY|nr:DNA polymerase III PolC-type domain protein [Corynebacterium simulans]KXU17113.1 DNA polymerase III PolC-type domain protein [Corynebacterium simulans]
MLNKHFGHEAAKMGHQILDQAEPFNAAHTTNWGLPCKPTVTRG